MTLRVKRNWENYRLRPWEQKMSARIVALLEEHPGSSPKELQNMLGTQVTLVMMLGVLECRGLVYHIGEGMSMKYYRNKPLTEKEKKKG